MDTKSRACDPSPGRNHRSRRLFALSARAVEPAAQPGFNLGPPDAQRAPLAERPENHRHDDGNASRAARQEAWRLLDELLGVALAVLLLLFVVAVILRAVTR
jgi:hypothetical protein